MMSKIKRVRELTPIGRRLVNKTRELGITYASVADDLGLSKNTLSLISRKGELPSRETLIKIFDRLGFKAEERPELFRLAYADKDGFILRHSDVPLMSEHLIKLMSIGDDASEDFYRELADLIGRWTPE